MAEPGILYRIHLAQGDITRAEAEAIVNAANEGLLPGGGVCGAIHAAAGPGLARACREAAPCPTGDARITPGFDLRARWVIHAVGPVWRSGEAGEPGLLRDAYQAALGLCQDRGITSVAFPLISTGIYGFPMDLASRIALEAIRDWLALHDLPETVTVMAYDARAMASLQAAKARV